MTALEWTRDKGHYALLNAVMIGLWIVSWIALAVLNVPGSPIDDLLAFAVLWNIVSFRRIIETRLWFLHLAPYVTYGALNLLFWAFTSGQAIYAGQPPPNWWQAGLQLMGYPLFPAWPAATIVLIVVQERQK